MHWRGLRQELRARPAVVSVLTSVVIVAAGVGAFGVWHQLGHSSSPSFGNLPIGVVEQVKSFKVYWLKPSFSTDFVLQPSSVHYDSKVLVFSMVNSVGKTLAFTEQIIPPHFNSAVMTVDTNIDTEFGRGYIVSDSSRTTGALVTSDNTWIIVNAPQSIGSSLMQQILQALVPAKSA